MARLYSNENFPLPVVRALRALGHDVLTSHEAGRANRRIPDQQVLVDAIVDGRALLTLNRRDFFRIHRKSADHAGIIACTPDSDYPRQAQRIHDQVATLPSLDRRLIRVNRPG